MQYKKLSLILFLTICALALPLLVMAQEATVDGITMTTPNTYSSCSDSVESDTITATGLTATHQLVGQVIVSYITDNVPQQVPGGFYPVNHFGPADFSLQVSYPPVSQWPVQSNGTAEIHVDVQIEVFDNGFLVGTLGPGIDWDVFCLGRPTPTPTSTPTNTPTPTPPPSGDDGCTPGYWKQAQHFDSWTPTGYLSTQTLESVFDLPDSLGLDNFTLLQALNFGGGSDTVAAARILLRASVAALLNSAHPTVDYPRTTADVIASVNAALASNNRNSMLTLASALDTDNNLGCTLN
jgi:hypothetical protein